jgi:hypothetical protein
MRLRTSPLRYAYLQSPEVLEAPIYDETRGSRLALRRLRRDAHVVNCVPAQALGHPRHSIWLQEARSMVRLLHLQRETTNPYPIISKSMASSVLKKGTRDALALLVHREG